MTAVPARAQLVHPEPAPSTLTGADHEPRPHHPVPGFPGHPIVAEVRDGPPSFTIVGWPARDTEEMRHQVQRLLGPLYPSRRPITVDIGQVSARGGLLDGAIARAIHIDHTY